MTDTTDLKARLRAYAHLARKLGNWTDNPHNAGFMCTEAADALDAKDLAIARLKAALKECVAVMGETLDKDFGFWSSPAQDDRRSRFYPAWKNASEALKGQTP